MDLPTPLRAPTTLAELCARIRERIRDFDVSALLDLLLSVGYDLATIEFRGNMSAAPQPSMVHDIELRAAPGEPGPAGVTITVNLGLSSCRSPLPSYLQRLCGELETSDPFIELLRVLDRSLLHTRLALDQPERLLASWPSVRRDFLGLHGLDSPLGLHWLFRAVFPELGVRVRRQTDAYHVTFTAARLGSAALGRCAFGNTSRITVHDIEVTLVGTESAHEGQPWLRVADVRIRRFVLPLLDEVCMNLTIAFVLLDQGTTARLAPGSYVGYDPMMGPLDDEGDDHVASTRIVLYRGALPVTEPDTDELEQVLVAGEGDRLELQARQWWDRPHAAAPATPRGRELELSLAYAPPRGHRCTYDVTVSWGVRAWYVDEPCEIALVIDGTPKTNPNPGQHPSLWRWLRDEARIHLANRVAIEIMALEPEETVSPALVDRLIEANDRERLEALALSPLSPPERWDEAAWRRFASWKER